MEMPLADFFIFIFYFFGPFGTVILHKKNRLCFPLFTYTMRFLDFRLILYLTFSNTLVQKCCYYALGVLTVTKHNHKFCAFDNHLTALQSILNEQS